MPPGQRFHTLGSTSAGCVPQAPEADARIRCCQIGPRRNNHAFTSPGFPVSDISVQESQIAPQRSPRARRRSTERQAVLTQRQRRAQRSHKCSSPAIPPRTQRPLRSLPVCFISSAHDLFDYPLCPPCSPWLTPAFHSLGFRPLRVTGFACATRTPNRKRLRAAILRLRSLWRLSVGGKLS